jgi:hypothetical protein
LGCLASLQAGYGVALARVSLQREVPFGIRQLAAVVLKQYVKHHWMPSSKHFAPPVCDEGDKAAIRALLPDGLRDETPKIRTAIGMAIAGIAKWDWPEAWPDLLPLLVNMLRTRPTPDAGATRLPYIHLPSLHPTSFNSLPFLALRFYPTLPSTSSHSPQPHPIATTHVLVFPMFLKFSWLHPSTTAHPTYYTPQHSTCLYSLHPPPRQT